MKRSWRRLLLPWVGIVLIGLLAAALRITVIEPAAMAHRCAQVQAPGWCPLRQQLVLGFLHYMYGYFALVATALALFSRRPALAWLAAATGAFALQMYCYEAGAFALLLGSLRLLRLQADRAPPAQQHRQRERQVQPQP